MEYEPIDVDKVEQYREEAEKILTNVRVVSHNIDAHFVVMFWEDTLCNTLANRVAYFNNTNDALLFRDILKERYNNMGIPYYITSSAFQFEDTGLFT